jgi:putative ABC transport system permease protein
MSYDTYFGLRAGASALADAGMYETRSFNLDSGSQREHVMGAALSASLFKTLGVRPVLGRAFASRADLPGVAGEVVLSHGLWERLFGGDPHALGRSVRLNGAAYTVVGVMSPRFQFPQRDSALWIPVTFPIPNGTAAGFQWIGQGTLIARLAPGSGLAQLRAQGRAVLARQMGDLPADLRAAVDWFRPEIDARPLRAVLVHDLEHRLNLAQWITGLLLALVWFNFANLFIARALSRRDELVMRRVLGADAWTLLRELLLESLPLCALGGALGLAFGHALLATLLRTGFDTSGLTFPADIWRVAALIALGLSLLSALVFALAGLYFVRRDLAGALKEADARSGGGRGELRVRTALVTAQLALAASLCSTGIMLAHGLMRLEQVRVGFQPAHVLTLRMYFPPGFVATSPALASLLTRMRSAVAGLPGVQAATIANQIPFGGDTMCSVVFPYPAGRMPASAQPLASSVIADPEYFRTLDVPLRAGREFPAAGHQGGMVLDARAARALFGTAHAVGRMVTFAAPIPGHTTAMQSAFPVIGVVGDTRFWYTGPAGLKCEGTAYRDLSQFLLAQGSSPWSSTPWFMAIRTPLPAAGMLPELRRVLARIAPGVPIYDVRTLHDRMAEHMRPHRNIVILGLLLSAGALAIAAVGLYAVQSYAVTRRWTEFGIRGALGATRNGLLGLVLRETLRLLAVGLAIGLAGTAVLGRMFAGVLYGVRMFDPLAMLLVLAVLSLTALLAGGIPAWRASRVPPMEAIRDL